MPALAPLSRLPPAARGAAAPGRGLRRVARRRPRRRPRRGVERPSPRPASTCSSWRCPGCCSASRSPAGAACCGAAAGRSPRSWRRSRPASPSPRRRWRSASSPRSSSCARRRSSPSSRRAACRPSRSRSSPSRWVRCATRSRSCSPPRWVIGAAVLVAANAALLRLYLLRRDPGWLEDGEFERVRWPLGLVVGLRAVRGRRGPAPGEAGRLQRAPGDGASSSPSRGWRWWPSTRGAWPGPRCCARGGRAGAGQPLGPADPRPAGAVRQLVRLPPLGRAPARAGRGDPPWTVGVIQSRGESWS